VGCDFEIGTDDIGLVGADANFVGHVHMKQHWMIGSAPCIYPGSPRRCNYGETEPKGYVVAEWDDQTGDLVGWEFIEAPATPMYHVDDEWTADGWAIGPVREDTPDSFAGAEVRLRYRVRSDQRVAARAAAEACRDGWLADGAIAVKLDEQVVLEQRTRAAAIPVQATLAEKLQAFWAAKSFEPGERRAALLAKLQLIEEASHAA
jgi:hypothetical protein